MLKVARLAFVSEACQTSTSDQVTLKRIHILLPSRQPAHLINLLAKHMADEFDHVFSRY